MAPKVMFCGVSGAALTVKLRETGVAAAYTALPACDAVMVQVPCAVNEAVDPDTEQTLDEEAV
jgi:hypothetical protein